MQVAKPTIRTRGHTRIPSSPTPLADANPTRQERLVQALQRCPTHATRAGCAPHWPGCSRWRSQLPWPGAAHSRRSDSGPPRPRSKSWPRSDSPSGSAPDESTLRKPFAHLDADALDAALGVCMWTHTFTVEQRRVIALDGKTIRGARTRAGGKAPHLIAAFDHGAGVVLATGGRRCEEQRNSRCPNTVEALRSQRCGGDPRCDAHPDRHRCPDHRRWRRLRVHGEGEHAHPAPQAQDAALEGHARHRRHHRRAWPARHPNDQGPRRSRLDRLPRCGPSRPTTPHRHRQRKPKPSGRST